jgi:Protein of unknown function (DUF3575)
MKKIALLILFTSTLFAQKPTDFALKYNFAPNIFGKNAFGVAMEFPVSKIMSVDLSHAKGNFNIDEGASDFWNYQTSVAELRFNLYKVYKSTNFIAFLGPYIRHKYVDRYREGGDGKDLLGLYPKVDFESKAVSLGAVCGINVALKERFVLEFKMGLGYGKRYEIIGNDFPNIFLENPYDGVAGISFGYNFKK